MKFKIVQGFLVQYIDDEDKVLKTSFVPGDKFILDAANATIDNGKNKIPFDDNKELARLDFMPFGKYKDVKMVDLDLKYIYWAVDNVSDKLVVAALREELERRNKLNEVDDIPF